MPLGWRDAAGSLTGAARRGDDVLPSDGLRRKYWARTVSHNLAWTEVVGWHELPRAWWHKLTGTRRHDLSRAK